jgi:hypothetical protein
MWWATKTAIAALCIHSSAHQSLVNNPDSCGAGLSASRLETGFRFLAV